MVIASAESHCSMELLAKRLCARVDVSSTERELLLTRSHPTRRYEAGATVPRPADRHLRPTMIVSGWACRERISASGHRQLLSILMPGDLIWGGSEERPLDLLEVVALNKLKVANVASAMLSIARDPASFPSIARGLKMIQLAEENQLIEHSVRLASRAHQRVAGLILELFERCRSIGFVTGESFVMPLTQESLGNFVGLSIVHVNRVMRHLKAEGVVRLKPGMVEILDLSGLAFIAGTSLADHHCAGGHNRQTAICPRWGCLLPEAMGCA